jgi:hypothetical protein
VDVDATERSTALLLRTSDQAHLQDGHFDSERMLKMLNESIEKALDDGFAGLRTCGDMSWLADTPPGAHQVIEYEAVLNQLFRNVHGLGMCQYDRKRLPAHLVDLAGRRSFNPRRRRHSPAQPELRSCVYLAWGAELGSRRPSRRAAEKATNTQKHSRFVQKHKAL